MNKKLIQLHIKLTSFALVTLLIISCQHTTQTETTPCCDQPASSVSSQFTPDINGILRLQWRLQSQENVYGFQVYQAEKEEGPFVLANQDIIPGHDTTSIPQTYHYYITGLEVGKKYFFYIDEVTYDGQTNKISPIGSSEAKIRDYYLDKGYEDVP